MEYFQIAILFSLLCFVSTVKYFPGYQRACVKENDINNFVEEMCKIIAAANESDFSAMKDIFTDDATFTYMNQPAVIIKKYFDVLIKFNEAIYEYYNISKDKICSTDLNKYNVYGCEHNKNPSFIKGQWNIKGKDRKHSLESNYYQEVEYEGGKVKVSKSTISSTMTVDVFKKLTKNIKDDIPFIIISQKNSLVPVTSTTMVAEELQNKEKDSPVPITSSTNTKKGLQDKEKDSPISIASPTKEKEGLHDKDNDSPVLVTSTPKIKEELQDKKKNSPIPVTSSTNVKEELQDKENDSPVVITSSPKIKEELQDKKKNSPELVTSSTKVKEELQDKHNDSPLPITASTKVKVGLKDQENNSPVPVISSTKIKEELPDKIKNSPIPVTSSTTVKGETQDKEKEKLPENEDYEDNNSTTAQSSEITSQSPEPGIENKDECEDDDVTDA